MTSRTCRVIPSILPRSPPAWFLLFSLSLQLPVSRVVFLAARGSAAKNERRVTTPSDYTRAGRIRPMTAQISLTELRSVLLYLTATTVSALTLLVGRQEGHPACKNLEWWGAGVVICLERGADLHTAQLMPLPLTVSCFSKIQIGFTFLRC